MRTVALVFVDCPDRIGGPRAARMPGGITGGNQAAGAAIVGGKGTCLTCHGIQGKGSRLGPDLTDIGTLRTPEQLMTSLLEPDAEILPRESFLSCRRARRRHHLWKAAEPRPPFRILMLDEKEQLQSSQKSELREHGFIKDVENAIVSRAVDSPGARRHHRRNPSTLKGVAAQ